MEISNIEITSYNIPLPEPVEAYAAGIMKAFDLVICRIKNDDGIEGVGYITVHENQGQAIATIIKNSFELTIYSDHFERGSEAHLKRSGFNIIWVRNDVN